MLKAIVLVQHCQSEHHVNDLTGGWTDTPLTDLGRRQAVCVAGRLKDMIGDAPCRIWTSDLKRAFQTADVIGQEFRLVPVQVRDLREFNAGIAAGKTRAWAKEHAARGPETNLDRQPFPESETPRTFYERTVRCLDGLSEEFDNVVVLVTHGGTVANILIWWLGLGVEVCDKFAMRTQPGSISVLRVGRRQEHAVAVLGDMSHLYEAGLAEKEKLT